MQHYILPPIKVHFSEGTPEKIQIMRVGTFYDERYGKVEITSKVLIAMADNFEKKVRGVDIALDFAHKTDGPAAGWIKRLSVSQDELELWAEVDWTNAGKENLLGKEYRYVSPDFTFAYKDNESLIEHGPVLLGAGLTNRPVIKGMAPAISLQEYKGEEMNPEEVKAALAAKDAKIAELEGKLAAADKGAVPPPKPGEEQLEEGIENVSEEQPEGEEEMDKELLKKNSELAAQNLALQNELNEKTAKIEMSEKSAQFDKMLSESKVVEAQRDAFLKGDMTEFLSKAMPVKMSEIGSGAETIVVKDDTKVKASDKVMTFAEEHIKAGKSVGDAIKMVLSAKPELRKEYEAEVKI